MYPVTILCRNEVVGMDGGTDGLMDVIKLSYILLYTSQICCLTSDNRIEIEITNYSDIRFMYFIHFIVFLHLS